MQIQNLKNVFSDDTEINSSAEYFNDGTTDHIIANNIKSIARECDTNETSHSATSPDASQN